MLPRTLEPEIMDTFEEADEYDQMDHSEVNRRFVDDLLDHQPLGRDILDVGTGTALIPIELCTRNASVRVMAFDGSTNMLDMARYHIEVNSLTQRIQLQFGDAKKMIFQDTYFDSVISNSIIHHIPDAKIVMQEMIRVLRPGGLVFVRDLCRPDSESVLEDLVAQYAAHETEYSRQLFRQSLHAAYRWDEVQAIVQELGFHPSSIAMNSDRHWTWIARKPEGIHG